MALPDLTGQNIQDTYKRVLTVGDDKLMYDGTGSVFTPLSASHEITTELSSSYAETASAAYNFNIGNEFILGDVNEDLVVDVLDIILVINFIMQVEVPSIQQEWTADINEDNLINIQDIILLVQIILDHN